MLDVVEVGLVVAHIVAVADRLRAVEFVVDEFAAGVVVVAPVPVAVDDRPIPHIVSSPGSRGFAADSVGARTDGMADDTPDLKLPR